jgi:tetratricopeptide (TPR) repeat protein
MFELLLQADKALTEGSFDQAERTYWQLIELDPTNAIAVAGLARVSLERGDEKSARTFADQALGIDPDSIAARKVLAILEHAAVESGRAEPPELPLRAAQRLEALSKRRSVGGPTTDQNAGPARGGRSEKPGSRTEKAGKEGRGRTRPDEIVPLPSEPLRERREAGRQAAAAAAAAAAAREPVKARRQVHHAMPVGRRFFGPEGLKVPLADAFSEAEMAAAVAAVDDLDDPGVAFVREGVVAGHADVMGAVDATAADESVALRLALMMDVADLEAAEREAAQSVDTEPGTDPFDAAEVEAAGFVSVEPAAAADAVQAVQADAHDFADAESDAAAEAVTEVAADDDDRDFDLEPPPRRRTIVATVAEDPSEEEAEAQALREALALVLEGEGEGRSVHVTAAEVPPAQAAADEIQAEATTSPEVTPETEPRPDSPSHKRGLFHRIRGS